MVGFIAFTRLGEPYSMALRLQSLRSTFRPMIKERSAFET